MNATKTKRNLALFTGAALLAPAFLPALATPARADDSGKYKTGAAVLGAAAAYFAIRGKTLPGVLAGAGAYYAYKKSRDAKNDRYGSNSDPYYGSSRDNRRSRNNNRDNSNDNTVYDDTRDNGSYNNDNGQYDDNFPNSDTSDQSYNRDDSAYNVGGYDAFPDDPGYIGLQKAPRTENAARPTLK